MIMQNASIILGLSLRYFPISPSPSMFSSGNRKGEVYVGGWVMRRWCRVDPQAITEQPLVFPSIQTWAGDH
jgi:hypothetical protein